MIMFKLSVENRLGNRLSLSNNPKYTIISVTGLNPAKASINTAVNAAFDGSTFKSSRLENRNIVIMLAIEGAVEANRIELYKYIRVKDEITVYFANASRDLYIKGYVESMEIGLFDMKQAVQISIICPNPYFQNTEGSMNNFSTVHSLFEFPFSIDEEGIPFGEIVVDEEVNVQNFGDVPTGMIIEFRAVGAVLNPAIYNTDINAFMRINDTMADGDVIQINTKKGEKGVYKISGGSITNILNKLDDESTWLTLEAGDNIMMFTAASGAIYLQCAVYHNNLYEGV